MKLKINRNCFRGFTLLELMIVIGIIGVLLAGSFFAYIQILERSRVNQAVSDIQMIRQAIEQYHADMGHYPPDTSPATDPGLITFRAGAACAPWCPAGYGRVAATSYRGPYLNAPAWPVETPWGGRYDYEYWPAARMPSIIGTPFGGCSGMVGGIYVTVRPDEISGITPTSPSEFAEEFFQNQDQDSDFCGRNGMIFYLIKRL